jgi:tryptophan synthase alpha chain
VNSPIAQVFDQLRAKGHLAFIPFVTAGDPSLEVTGQLIRTLDHAGADLIEVGFPYSDPIADGPVIQSSYTRALGRKIKTREIFQMVASQSKEVKAPLVAMVSYAIIFRIGAVPFTKEAKEAGFSGLIVPDLPGDEASEFAKVSAAAGLDLIPLVAPTTPAERVKKILSTASGFVYCIAVAGVTGARATVAATLDAELAMLRTMTALPLAVGFGISGRDQVLGLKGKADGAIVGSALVKYLEACATDISQVDTAIGQIKAAAMELASAAHQ